jgi:hypothetical protein
MPAYVCVCPKFLSDVSLGTIKPWSSNPTCIVSETILQILIKFPTKLSGQFYRVSHVPEQSVFLPNEE